MQFVKVHDNIATSVTPRHVQFLKWPWVMWAEVTSQKFYEVLIVYFFPSLIGTTSAGRVFPVS